MPIFKVILIQKKTEKSPFPLQKIKVSTPFIMLIRAMSVLASALQGIMQFGVVYC